MAFPLIPLALGGFGLLAGAGLAGGGGGLNLASPRTESGGLGGSGLFEIGTKKELTTNQTTTSSQYTDARQSTSNFDFTYQNVTGGSSATLDKETSLRPSQTLIPSQSVIPSVASPTGIPSSSEGTNLAPLIAIGLIGTGAYFIFKKGGKK